MSRIDVFKSLFRAGADRASERLGRSGPLPLIRRALRELKDQKIVIGERQLTNAVVHAPGITSATVTARRGSLHFDLSFDDGAHLACALTPDGVRFAPQGAKELRFAVHPADACRHSGLRDAVGALAASVAEHTWSAALGTPKGQGIAIVDRDGEGGLRVDLRSAPALRQAKGNKAAAMMIEVLGIRRLVAEDGGLAIELQLPPIFG